LSRKQKRKDIELLILDSDPAVIESLLANPMVTEKDVIRIAARHQAPTDVLLVICKSNRWMSGYRVKKALALNPQTPLAYAVGLVRHLKLQDLRFILSGGSSRAELPEAARARLKNG
jgi:hypothetical protein